MLYSQIDSKVLKTLSMEVKVDLKIASATLRKAEDPSPSRMAKLRIVEKFIGEHHSVGTNEDPGAEYFRGRMDMQWGWLASSIVFFRGSADSQIIMLAGSRRHVMGEAPGENAFVGSALPHIITAVKDYISDRSAIEGLPIESAEWANPFRATEVRLNTPCQKMEFLAIPLAEERWADTHLVLGTPLYVALASLQ